MLVKKTMTSALLLTAALAALWPWLLGFRAFGYLLRTAYPSMAQKLERLLPIALPRRTAIPTPLPTDPSLRVAVIGGGIAGAGCAFSIQNSRAGRVTLYEAAPALGGNAKVFDWSVQSRIVRTGLSVLAWPAYFHNYMALLEKLRVGTTSVRLPFAVQPGGSEDALYLQVLLAFSR